MVVATAVSRADGLGSSSSELDDDDDDDDEEDEDDDEFASEPFDEFCLEFRSEFLSKLRSKCDDECCASADGSARSGVATAIGRSIALVNHFCTEASLAADGEVCSSVSLVLESLSLVEDSR